MQEEQLSPYEVERASNGEVSHQTIRNIIHHGKVPSSDHIIVIAESIGHIRSWSSRQRRELADEMLASVNSRARYHVSVRRPLSASLLPATA